MFYLKTFNNYIIQLCWHFITPRDINKVIWNWSPIDPPIEIFTSLFDEDISDVFTVVYELILISSCSVGWKSFRTVEWYDTNVSISHVLRNPNTHDTHNMDLHIHATRWASLYWIYRSLIPVTVINTATHIPVPFLWRWV